MEDFEEYKWVRNVTNDYVKNTKRDYERCTSQKVKKEPKQFWRYVKSKTQSVGGVFNLKNDNGVFTKSEAEKVELLNDLFLICFYKRELRHIT